ncbi:substrate-binding domain-containing protein [Spirillospora sp. NPDC047279]|uniref:substrate-binding domain-containing protein n=1 Tax=Spirillospora sp. NPDC047279 TaxID=3155478 RepID=UPI0033E2EE47
MSVVVLIVVAGSFAVFSSREAGCEAKASLSVMADPAVAPALTAVAGRVNQDEDACLSVIVNTAPSAVSAMALGGDRSAVLPARADAVILDSSLWLDVAARTAARTGAVPPRRFAGVASSPVTFVRAKGTGGDAGSFAWRSPRFSLRLTDPQRDASGMITLVAARGAAGAGEQGQAGFAGMLRGAQPGERGNVAADPESGLTSLRPDENGKVPVLAVPEQALWRRLRAGDALTAVPSAEQVAPLDFPLVMTGKGKDGQARRFLAAVGSPAGAAELAKVGLRAADGRSAAGVSAVTGLGGTAAAAPAPRPEVLFEALEMWQRMHLGTRMLALIDVSGSMNEQVPGSGRTRMAVTAGEVSGGMALLPDDAEVGVWSFSTGMNGRLPYRELSAISRLGGLRDDGTQRAALQRALGGMRAKPDGDTGLYDSVLAAFRSVKAGYRGDMLNFVLVLTDGRNDFEGGIGEGELLAALKKEYDPARPVQVIGMGFGPGVDLGALERVSGATGGAAYQIRDPRQIRELFRRSAALRVCDDPRSCPAG